jgi:hypothetical protein
LVSNPTGKNGYRLKLARKQDFCICQTGLPKEDGESSEKHCRGQPENLDKPALLTKPFVGASDDLSDEGRIRRGLVALSAITLVAIRDQGLTRARLTKLRRYVHNWFSTTQESLIRDHIFN